MLLRKRRSCRCQNQIKQKSQTGTSRISRSIQWISEPLSSLEELPDEVKALIDIENEDKTLYVQRDHTPAYLSLSEELKAKGVIFTDILTAAREHSDLVEKYFMKDGVKVDEHKLTALHAALVEWRRIRLCSEKCSRWKSRFRLFMSMKAMTAALFNHVLIVAEDNSSVTYVENYISTVKTRKTLSSILSVKYSQVIMPE